jgi:hypothetical protein
MLIEEILRYQLCFGWKVKKLFKIFPAGKLKFRQFFNLLYFI